MSRLVKVEKDEEKSVRLIALYINGVLWKYVPLNMTTKSQEAFSFVRPTYVTIRARQKYKMQTLSQYTNRIKFVRVDIPLTPNCTEIGYYAVSHNLVVSEPGTGRVTFDIPSDPEAQDEGPWKT